jgi:hypothetical protein
MTVVEKVGLTHTRRILGEDRGSRESCQRFEGTERGISSKIELRTKKSYAAEGATGSKRR